MFAFSAIAFTNMRMTELRSTPAYGTVSKYGLSVIESHHSPDFHMDWSRTTHIGFMYVLNGEGQLATRKATYLLSKRTMIVIPRNLPYRVLDSPGKPLSLFLLWIFHPQIERMARELTANSVQLATHRPTSYRIPKLLKDILFEQASQRPGSEIAMVALALELVVTMIRFKSEKPDGAALPSKSRFDSRARVEAYVRELAHDFYRPQNLEHIATAAGLQIRQFRTLFREIAGTSWLRYIRRRRINYAKQLLRETDHSIMAVCFECGFEDLSNFYRCFQEMERISPDAWRRSNQLFPSQRS